MSSETPPKRQLPTISPHHAHAEDGEGNWLVSYADMMTLLVGFFVILLSFSSIDQEKMEGVRKAITQEFGGTYKVPYEQLRDRIAAEMKKLGLGDAFVITQNPDGVDISFLGTVFFEPGLAEMRDVGREMVQKIIPILRAEAKDFNLVIEGHTDDTPMASSKAIHNNWELSSLRACRVLELFSAAGFDSKHLLALGYGDTRPVLPNRDAAGEPIGANQSQNRRVVIKVLRPTAQLIDNSAAPKTEPKESAG